MQATNDRTGACCGAPVGYVEGLVGTLRRAKACDEQKPTRNI
jgi:hypothetical protein